MYTQKESEPRQIVSDKLCQTNCVNECHGNKKNTSFWRNRKTDAFFYKSKTLTHCGD